MDLRTALIRHYFNLGLKYKDIVHVLFNTHGLRLSLRQLKRILEKISLHRRKGETDIMYVVDFIIHEQRGSGSLHGYRWMYQKLKCHGLNPRKEDVRLLLRLLDPEGTELRQRHCLRRRQYHAKGPNYIWHVDSYDKLRPYGICINGCIDGYSRKIIWLNSFRTSSDPRVIGGYYVEAVKMFSGCPVILRGDRGTENRNLCEFQRFLRRNGDDAYMGNRSFMYGRSTSNQRIESWWGFLRRQCIEFWLACFDQLKADGYFEGNFLDKNLVLFCFLSTIQVKMHMHTFFTSHAFYSIMLS